MGRCGGGDDIIFIDTCAPEVVTILPFRLTGGFFLFAREVVCIVQNVHTVQDNPSQEIDVSPALERFEPNNRGRVYEDLESQM